MPCINANQVAEYLDGALLPEEAVQIEEHVDGCAACRTLLSDLARCAPAVVTPPSPPPVLEESALSPRIEVPLDLLPRGTTIQDRYLVLDLIGMGGMGVVYAAYDQTLDRKVALKLVRSDLLKGAHGSPGQARLQREARLMARLSHPNVLVVYDVGTIEGQIFISMEFVEGQTVRRWLRQAERPGERRILEVFLDAARGLHAAHQAGVVHRDFKPENVLIGKDGRVRVTDFGLARPLHLQIELPEGEVASPGGEIAEGMLTRPGVLAGTPTYMAPEQYLGQAVDARTDQFAFCVALYEALYGEHPFAGRSFEEISAAVKLGKVRPPPSGGRVPARLRSALLRGLSVAPDSRFPSMDALREALAPAPRGSFWRRALGLGALGAAALLGALWVRVTQEPLCRGAEQKLVGVWDAPRRHAVEQAFQRTGLPYAGKVFQATARRLDDHARRLAAMHREACEATHLRGEQSQEMLDQRMHCLEQRLSELRALTELFTRADAQVLEGVDRASEGLGGLDACTPARLLRTAVPLPRDERTRQRVAELSSQLAGTSALEQIGGYSTPQRVDAALPDARRIAAEALALGYRPSEAQALFHLGSLLSYSGDHVGAEAALYQGLLAAEAAGDVANQQYLWFRLSQVVGSSLARHAEGYRLGQHTLAMIDRTGDEGFRPQVLDHMGMLLQEQGRLREAREHHERARAERERIGSTDPLDLARSLNIVGSLYQAEGRHEEALGHYRRALELREKELGPQHSRVAGVLNNIGSALQALGRRDEALAQYQRALSIREGLLGSHHHEVAAVLMNLGSLYADLGDSGRAQQQYERALAIREQAFGAAHPLSTEARFALARALWANQRERRRALELAAAAQKACVEQGPCALQGQIKEWLAQHRP